MAVFYIRVPSVEFQGHNTRRPQGKCKLLLYCDVHEKTPSSSKTDLISLDSSQNLWFCFEYFCKFKFSDILAMIVFSPDINWQ